MSFPDFIHPSENNSKQDIPDFGPVECAMCCGCASTTSLAIITTTAILILGCLAIGGIVGNLGYITLGLGAGLVVLGGIASLTSGTKQYAGFCAAGVYFIVMGALGGVGILNSVNLGWAMIAPTLLSVGCSCLASYGGSSIGSSLAIYDPNRFAQLSSQFQA